MIKRFLAVLATFCLLGSAAASTRELVAQAKPAIVYLKSSEGSGTGFFVSDDGRIVTNYHVIDSGSGWKAIDAEGREIELEGVLAVDVRNDIAILKAAPGKYPFLKLSQVGNLEQGTRIYVLGHPAGLRLTLSDGLVSAFRKGEELKEFFPEEHPAAEDIIQLTAPISSGSSGSPVMLENGEAVAVVTSQLTSAQNLNFAVPIAVVQRLLGEIESDQKVMSFRKAQAKRIADTPWLKIGVNLLISLALFAGIFFGWKILTKERG